jgi:HAD superfamily hydrolase (TIGR01509 family)
MVRGVIFDLDGTLFDADYDWPEIKRRLGVGSPEESILDFLERLPEEEREQKEQMLEQIEDRATESGSLRPGAAALLESLGGQGLKLALVTNNRRELVNQILGEHGLQFDLVLTRDSGLHKPSGAPLLRAAQLLGLHLGELAAVGDGEFDLQAAREAGLGLVIIVNPEVDRFVGRSDYAVRDLGEAQSIFAELLGQRR